MTYHRHSLHQRHTSNLVLADTNHVRRLVRRSLEQRVDRVQTLQCRLQNKTKEKSKLIVRNQKTRQTHQDTIIRTRPPTTLSVAQSRNTGIQAKTLAEDLPDGVGMDRVEVSVVGTFGDDDNRLALSDFTVLVLISAGLTISHRQILGRRTYVVDGLTHLVLPRLAGWRTLRNDDKVCSSTE